MGKVGTNESAGKPGLKYEHALDMMQEAILDPVVDTMIKVSSSSSSVMNHRSSHRSGDKPQPLD